MAKNQENWPSVKELLDDSVIIEQAKNLRIHLGKRTSLQENEYFGSFD